MGHESGGERRATEGGAARNEAQQQTEPATGSAALDALVGRFGAVGAQRFIQQRRIQRRASAGAASPSGQQAQAAAEHGLGGAGGALPHRDAIQAAFGRHDVSGIQAHVGGVAGEGAKAMGAEAFASGEQVAFVGAPSLHTAAHEVAHVVQQRGGVQLSGGLGQSGDEHERHADAVADRVAAGQSAEALLDQRSGQGGAPASGGQVQRKKPKSEQERLQKAKPELEKQLVYETLMAEFVKNEGRRYTIDELLEIGENGSLFVEIFNLPAGIAYEQKKVDAKTSMDEKLHIPATVDDIEQRWNIVSKILLAYDVRNFKVARKEMLQKMDSGTECAFRCLVQEKLIPEQEFDPKKKMVEYVTQATTVANLPALTKFTQSKRQFTKEDLDSGDVAFSLVGALDGQVADSKMFPKEQAGREITVYVLPGMKPVEEWQRMANEISAALRAAKLPPLPLASGDQKLPDGTATENGAPMGYFSYRDEATAKDPVLNCRMFPHWMGGNADNANASGAALQLDGVKVDPLHADATKAAQSLKRDDPSMFERVKAYFSKRFG